MRRAVLAHLEDDTPFPHPSTALNTPNGLLASGGDLSPKRLLSAYRQGIFPWFSEGEPILWWSPNPRMVLYLNEFAPSHSLLKTLRRGNYEIRIDQDFDAVMQGCAAPRDGQAGTWITPAMQSAYHQLFEDGHAHAIATWMDGKLVGGLYGIAVGQVFCGESMFSWANDASKLAFAHLVALLRHRGFRLIDCQMHTPHLASLGAREIPRTEFLQVLAELGDHGDPPGLWDLPDSALGESPWRT